MKIDIKWYKTNQSIFSIIEPAEGSLLGLVPPLRDPRPALELFVTISTEKMQQNLNQPEDVDGLSVAAAGEEGSAGREWEREDGGGSLQTSAQLVQLRSVVAGEHSVRFFLWEGNQYDHWKKNTENQYTIDALA